MKEYKDEQIVKVFCNKTELFISFIKENNSVICDHPCIHYGEEECVVAEMEKEFTVKCSLEDIVHLIRENLDEGDIYRLSDWIYLTYIATPSKKDGR